MSFAADDLSLQASNEDLQTHELSITIENIIALRPKCNQSKINLDVYFDNVLLYNNVDIPNTDPCELNETLKMSIPFGKRFEYEKYLSNPLLFIVKEIENVEGFVEVSEIGDSNAGVAMWHSDESILDLKQALLGTAGGTEKSGEGDELPVVNEKKGKKSKAGSKTSSKVDKKEETGRKKQLKVEDGTANKNLGVGVMDLAPLMFGETEIREAVLLDSEAVHHLDDRMLNESKLPRIEVHVTLDKPVTDGHLIAITVESIYNIPQSLFGANFSLSLNLPTSEPTPITFSNFKLETQPSKSKCARKKWFGSEYKTAYTIEGDFVSAKRSIEERYLRNDVPRMECNTVRRVFCTINDVDGFMLHVKKNRNLSVSVEVGVEVGGGKEKKGKSVAEETREYGEVNVDVSRLLYPGESRVRAVCDLGTFGQRAAEARRESAQGSTEEVDRKVRSPSTSRHREGRPETRSKYTPQMQRLDETNVVEEEFTPMFVVLEVELDRPIFAKRKPDELDVDFRDLLEELPPLPKSVKSKDVSDEMYRQCVVRLMKDIKVQHVKFVQDTRRLGSEKDFLQFLEETGVYQSYLTTLMTSASGYVAATKTVDPEWTPAEYQRFISTVYVELVEKMNAVVNEVFLGATANEEAPGVDQERRLFFALEAAELGAVGLANRYFLQFIADEERSPNVWFDYAVYNLHCGDRDRAFECIKNALKHNSGDSRSLLCYAILLSQRDRLQEAETCLLSLTVSKPTWLFGWGALYLIYSRMGNEEGMEVVLDASQKHLSSAKRYKTTDLAWSSEGLPHQSLFSIMTAYFITLRLLDEAETMLSRELLGKDDESTQYLLSVISYYRKDYEHALLHIDRAINFDAFNHKFFAFKGHVLFAKDCTEVALAEYQKIFDLFTHPKDEELYLVLVRTALCHSKLGDSQKARQWFLRACKVTGTPYTWLCVSVLFFHQKDYLAAEECLQQSNFLDNWMPETWAYLALVNIRMGKKHEASMCLHYAEKHNLGDLQLLAQVQEEMKELSGRADH